MRNEVDPRLLHWLIEQNIKQKHPTLTALLGRLGVKIADENKTLYAWGWRRPGYNPEHIVTVWAEGVHMTSLDGWETAISLEPSGNPKYNDEQRQRESDRIKILRELAETGRECKVILMINRYSREDDEKGVAAEAELRVLDDERWYVEMQNGSHHGKLRRGTKRSAKADLNLEANEKESSEGQDASADPNLRFPDQEMRDRVERAAIEHAKREYARYGLVKSVEAENLGYDLAVVDQVSGELRLKVEVKGTAGEEEHFYLTRNEHRAANADPERWRLAVVVDALHEPALQEYSFQGMEKMFTKTPLVWHCEPKRG